MDVRGEDVTGPVDEHGVRIPFEQEIVLVRVHGHLAADYRQVPLPAYESDVQTLPRVYLWNAPEMGWQIGGDVPGALDDEFRSLDQLVVLDIGPSTNDERTLQMETHDAGRHLEIPHLLLQIRTSGGDVLHDHIAQSHPLGNDHVHLPLHTIPRCDIALNEAILLFIDIYIYIY